MCLLISELYMNNPRCSIQEQTVSTFQCLKGSEGSGTECSEYLEPPLDLEEQFEARLNTKLLKTKR